MKKLTLFVALLCSISAFSTRYLVQKNGQNVWNGTTSSGTVVTLGAAQTFGAWYNATAMTSGSEVWMLAGTYTIAESITLKSNVHLYGSFAGTETTTAGRSKVSGGNPWEFSNKTTINGNGGNYYVGRLFNALCTQTTYTDGIEFTNFIRTNSGNSAIQVRAFEIMQNCIVSYNKNTGVSGASASGRGAGVYLNDGQILNSYIHHNDCLIGTAAPAGFYACGGGVFMVYGTTSPTVKGCTFETNTATEGGGAIWMDSGIGTVENCTFKTNQVLASTYYIGTGGGAISSWSTNTGTLSIKNCQFVGNVATGSTNYGNGGAVYLNVNTTTTIDGCSFIGNTANGITGDAIRGGGALNLAYNNAAKTTIVKNCTFRDNKLTTNTPETSNNEVQGSALLLNTATTVQNCIFANNSSTGVGSTVFIKVNGCNIYNSVFAKNLTTGSGRALNTLTRTFTLTNCMFWGNSLVSPAIANATTGTTGTYNAFDTDESSQTGYYGTGSIKTLTASNTFVSPTSSTGANTDLTVGAAADWSLLAACPAINKGADLATSGVTTDILGNARPTGANAVDMGAYEYGFSTAQTITFGALSAKTYGDATFTLGATATSGLAVSYASSNTAVATVSGNTVTIVGAGSTNITASQAGNGSFAAASNVVQSLTVNPKTLTLTSASATSKTYTGTNAAVVSGTLTGIVNSDAVTCTTGTFASVNVGGPIAVTCILSGAKAGNYSLTQPGISANITAAPLTITGISGVNKVYDGTTTATLSGTAAYSGLVNGETSTVTGTASATF
ncbi:MAG: YDG domain-containing protein, partial [Paludibacter sp.]